jgi:hypothetical protein
LAERVEHPKVRAASCGGGRRRRRLTLTVIFDNMGERKLISSIAP